MATNFDGAFNDIGLVDIIINTPMGKITAQNLGPADVAVIATPGNGGNVMDVWEGSTGQLLANKSYKVKNWAVTIRFLRHSLDYCRGTYLVQEILNGNITTVGINIINKNFSTTTPNEYNAGNESLDAPQAFLVGFGGLEFGSGASGDFELSFKCSDADYVSGTYYQWGSRYGVEELGKTKLTNIGTDNYQGVNYPDDSNTTNP